MNRRTCACGAIIVCADLDGHTVWLDEQPGPDGTLSVREHGDSLDAIADGTGPYRRHTCAADPEPLDSDPAPIDTNSVRHELAARRDIAAARAVLDSRAPLTDIQRRAAELRANNPDLTYRQLAHIGGVTASAFTSALRSVRDRAERLNSTGTTP